MGRETRRGGWKEMVRGVWKGDGEIESGVCVFGGGGGGGGGLVRHLL